MSRKTEDIYSACRDGDDIFVREWIFQANNDVNQGSVCPFAEATAAITVSARRKMDENA